MVNKNFKGTYFLCPQVLSNLLHCYKTLKSSYFLVFVHKPYYKQTTKCKNQIHSNICPQFLIRSAVSFCLITFILWDFLACFSWVVGCILMKTLRQINVCYYVLEQAQENIMNTIIEKYGLISLKINNN